MREVSNRALSIWLDEAKRRALPESVICAGLPYDVAFLAKKDERIEWAAFARLMRNVSAGMDEAAVEALGASFVESPMIRHMVVFARLLFDVGELYKWIMAGTAGGGGGHQMFSCLHPKIVDHGAGHLEIELSLTGDVPMSREFFLVTKGTMAAVPRMVGAPSAQLTMAWRERGARFDVRYDARKSALGGLRRAIAWPFTARAAARELKDAHEELTDRYRELEDYRDNLELKVEQRTAELTAAQVELAAALADLQRAQASRDRLFANVNHDLRTPLTLVRLAARDLDRAIGDGASPARRALEVVDANASRLLRLVNGLLLLAASREGKLELRPEAADVGALIRGIARDWEVAARTKGVTITCDAPATLSAIVDEAALDRVVVNLISNASKVTPAGGTIKIALRTDGDTLVFEVADTGPGFEPAMKARLFERFVQGTAGLAAKERGTGLGLNLVAELIAGHGGTIEALDAPGGGALVRARLPWRRTDAVFVPAVGDTTVPADNAIHVLGPTTGRATILIAEDNPVLRRSIEEILTPSYRVLSAPDGLAALELAETHPVDALVTDLGMPGLDGYGLVERFRAMPQHRLVPVLVLSAQSAIDSRLKAFASGALDFVPKPFEPAELKARLENQLLLRSLALRLGEAERMSSIGRLASGFAHEVRNPVNGLANALPLLRRKLPEKLGVSEERLFGALDECTQRLVVLAERLIGANGWAEGSIEPFATVAEQAVARCRTHGAVLEAGPHVDVGVPCRGDELAGALAHLLDNAFLAAGDHGHVRFTSRVSGDALEVDIQDDGPGVPLDVRPRLFEPFVTTRPVGSGSGLGLYTARRVVELTGGAIELVAADVGAHFRVRLPIASQATR